MFCSDRGRGSVNEQRAHVAGGMDVSFTITAPVSKYTHPYIKASSDRFLPFNTPYPEPVNMAQGPTLTDVRVRNTRDSHIIFGAVAQGALPLITRRLTNTERRDFIRPGSVFVWEERGPESGSSGVRRLGVAIGNFVY